MQINRCRNEALLKPLKLEKEVNCRDIFPGKFQMATIDTIIWAFKRFF